MGNILNTKTPLACAFVVVLNLMFMVMTARGQVAEVDVVKWDLSIQKGSLELLDSERVSIVSESEKRINIAPGAIAFVEFRSSTKSTGDIGEVSNGLLRLVDGTRYTGWAEVEGGQFVWRNWWSGTVRPKVESIYSFVEHGRNAPPHADGEDVVVLANGDVISGLVLDIGSNIEIELVDETIIAVPIDRVKSVALVNPLKPSRGTRVWLKPGDEISIDDYQFDQGIGLRVGDHETVLSTSMTAIAFDVSGIQPLASIEPELLELEESPRYRIPRVSIPEGAWPLDAPWFELQGPLRAEWKLDAPGLGFVARVVLPEYAQKHGSVELVVLTGDEELYSMTLDSQRTSADIAVRVPGKTLVIELREGAGGPLQNTVRFERAVLLDSR